MEDLLNRPRYIYIMRNPVDRLISQYSFQIMRGRVRPAQQGRDLANTLLMLLAKSKHPAYDACISRYEKVVDPARIHLMFTENLFSPDKIQTECDLLCAYLGVRSANATVRHEVNRAPNIEVTPDLRRTLVEKLRPQYEFAATRFGSRVPDRWARDIDLVTAA